MTPAPETTDMRNHVFFVLACLLMLSAPALAQDRRPTVGVAFGGGSARGIAHVGVIKWFEEHRIPIDVEAGTSMGGLIGGAFASGMDAAELEDMIQNINWDEMFGGSNFAFRNIRRKSDARAYPSRLEFGVARGIVPPTSLNNGQQVDLLIGRIVAPYYDIKSFDELPTPFRAVAVDLLTATEVVMDNGSLATAMRATMSLPFIFPAVDRDGRLLVDGGAMNNVPADVVKAMGADRVVAVNVGDLADRTAVDRSVFGLAGATLDAMMRSSTKKSIAKADVIIDVPLQEFGSLDWRRSAGLMTAGYNAAEAMREQLLPLAVSEAEYATWKTARQSRRRTTLPTPTFVNVEGFSSRDQQRLAGLLDRHVGVAFDVAAFQTDLALLSGLDRYEAINWRFTTNPEGASGLLIQAFPKPYGPPFLMMGLNLENTTSDDFRIAFTARYLGYDLVGSGSELRVDGTLGSDPSIAAELYRPFGASPIFVAPYAGIANSTLDLIADDAIVARYGQTISRVGLNLGANLGRVSDIRIGGYVGRLDADVIVGAPGLPALEGKETVAEALWRYDGQDSPVVPTGGSNAYARLSHVFDGPDITPPLPTQRSSVRLTQLVGEGNRFWTVKERSRLFVLGGLGTSFDNDPLPIDQFALGSPLHLGAYNQGEVIGDHYYILTGGYLRQLGRLPDFMGGPIHAGGWLENGDAFNSFSDMTLRTQASVGVILDTLVGPVILAGSAGFDGRWRTYIGVGRIFSQRRQ
jgi:NTE family protein